MCSADSQCAQVLPRHVPGGLFGEDRDGHPVWYEHIDLDYIGEGGGRGSREGEGGREGEGAGKGKGKGRERGQGKGKGGRGGREGEGGRGK